MPLLRILRLQNPLYKNLSFSSIILNRTLISAPQLETKAQHDQTPKPTTAQTTETNIETGRQSNDLKKKLWDLKAKMRVLKEAESKYGKESEDMRRKKETERHTEKSEKIVEMKRKQGEGVKVLKELSPDMEMFVSHLYKEGYFSRAHFARQGLDFSCLVDDYARDFIKFAAEKFGKDHQAIAKWLTGSHLKKVALFGCPCLTKKNVVAAKRLRAYFKIQEDTVCSKCVLKHSCKFVNQKIWGGSTEVLNLNVVMRIITLYAMEAVQPELSVPNEIKASVRILLNEVLKLSQTT